MGKLDDMSGQVGGSPEAQPFEQGFSYKYVAKDAELVLEVWDTGDESSRFKISTLGGQKIASGSAATTQEAATAMRSKLTELNYTVAVPNPAGWEKKPIRGAGGGDLTVRA